jgi:hypothetical protein
MPWRYRGRTGEASAVELWACELLRGQHHLLVCPLRQQVGVINADGTPVTRATPRASIRHGARLPQAVAFRPTALESMSARRGAAHLIRLRVGGVPADYEQRYSASKTAPESTPAPRVGCLQPPRKRPAGTGVHADPSATATNFPLLCLALPGRVGMWADDPPLSSSRFLWCPRPIPPSRSACELTSPRQTPRSIPLTATTPLPKQVIGGGGNAHLDNAGSTLPSL